MELGAGSKGDGCPLETESTLARSTDVVLTRSPEPPSAVCLRAVALAAPSVPRVTPSTSGFRRLTSALLYQRRAQGTTLILRKPG